MQNQNSPSLPANISRQELREIVRSQLQALLEQEDLRGAKALLVPVQPVDIAAVIAQLPAATVVIAFRLLSKDEAIEVYEYLDSDVQQALIEEFKHQDVLDIVDKMSPDDRARLFDELPAKVVRRLLSQLSPTERQATTLLLGYEPGTAGRIMTTEYIALKENLTVAQALERVRTLAGSVAKTSGSLGEVVFVLSIARPTRRVYELKAPLQVASFPIRHHPAVCQVVLAVPSQLPQPRRDDAGEGANGGSYDGVSLGSSLRPRAGQTMQTILETNS